MVLEFHAHSQVWVVPWEEPEKDLELSCDSDICSYLDEFKFLSSGTDNVSKPLLKIPFLKLHKLSVLHNLSPT